LEAILMAAADPSLDVSRVEHLIKLHREMESQAAERAFNDALAAAQKEMAPITRDAVNEQTKSRYATYAALDTVVRPVYAKHGLALTFTTGATPLTDAVEIVAYVLGHGHSRRYSVVMPADGKGAKGGDVMTKTHAMASAISYGMRQVLRMAFNLATVDPDDDGNAAGGQRPKSAAQARRDNDYPRIERRIRQAQTFDELERVWKEEQPTIYGWPQRWREHAVEEKNNRKAQLGGNMAAFAESLSYLDREGGI
jgi:hypothetical protein